MKEIQRASPWKDDINGMESSSQLLHWHHQENTLLAPREKRKRSLCWQQDRFDLTSEWMEETFHETKHDATKRQSKRRATYLEKEDAQNSELLCKHRTRTNGRDNRALELEICCVPSAQVVTTVLLRGGLRSKTENLPIELRSTHVI